MMILAVTRHDFARDHSIKLTIIERLTEVEYVGKIEVHDISRVIDSGVSGWLYHRMQFQVD